MPESLEFRRQEAVNSMAKIVRSIEEEIAMLKSGKLDVARARVILQGRRAQIRSAEVVLQAFRLGATGNQDQKRARRVRTITAQAAQGDL